MLNDFHAFLVMRSIHFHFLWVVLWAIGCGEEPKPKERGEKTTAETKTGYASNAFGDSLHWVCEEPKKCQYDIKGVAQSNWEPFSHGKYEVENQWLQKDARCIESPWEIIQDDAWLRFLFPEKETPPNWLEEVIKHNGQQVPDTLWKRFFPNPYGGQIPIIHIIRGNLDDDPEQEIVLWYNRPPKALVICQTMVEFFDFKDGKWFLKKSVGPFFTTIEVKLIRKKKAILVAGSNATSDGVQEWAVLYSFKAGRLQVIE